MQIKQERLKERIERINEMSRDETGGYTRLAFGEKETKARMMAKEMMLEAGLSAEEIERLRSILLIDNG